MQILEKLNPFKICAKLNLGLWQCPSFLFVLMGLITITAMISTYFIAKLYTELEIVSIIIAGVAVIIFTIGHFIVNSVEQLAQINQMKTEFINIASHQLRTPLSSIKWSLDNLMNTIKNDYLQNIYQANQQMIKLVNDLLNVSRIDQGKLLLQTQKTNINQLTKKTIQEFKILLKASNTDLEFHPSQKLDLVKADTGMIQVVMQNLISNAVQYIQKSGKISKPCFFASSKIIIRTKKEKNNIVWQIQDNGIGIPKYQQKHIFKKFFRAETSLKFQTRGTGMGLYISHAIIKAHKGKIWFSSKLNQGTTFNFSLPLT